MTKNVFPSGGPYLDLNPRVIIQPDEGWIRYNPEIRNFEKMEDGKWKLFDCRNNFPDKKRSEEWKKLLEDYRLELYKKVGGALGWLVVTQPTKLLHCPFMKELSPQDVKWLNNQAQWIVALADYLGLNSDCLGTLPKW